MSIEGRGAAKQYAEGLLELDAAAHVGRARVLAAQILFEVPLEVDRVKVAVHVHVAHRL